MTGERTRRFPLGLADLVREPRRRDERPGESRAQPSGAGKSPTSATAQARPRASATGGGVAASPVRRADAATPGTARVAPAQKPATPSPAANKPTARVRPSTTVRNGAVPSASGGARPGGVRAAPSRNDFTQAFAPRAAAPSAGAPGVALNGALALTSERVRERMVERLRSNGITDTRVLQALATVPRHMFVDPGLAAQAYEDAALPIGHHQTISKPSVVARMLELAGAGRELPRVLEIGTGCGYQAAVLSQIARDVYSIERIKPLYERAKTNLRPLRIPNIRLHYGDGRLGLPSAAPFDAIVIAAAGFDVPQALLEQLAIGGRLVAPVAAGTDASGEATQVLTLVERTGPAQWRESRLDRVFFVPLKSGVI
ncbi:protein-L-isoaspartate(D-aspartate) O-methyltransferase [Paraburkholderia caballeronis]|uniref:protein-L-isoaspartate(D-aspartate) O-methyltransferase n=1 Tax=Paraburkholderia caballeronis TaxID=416943 RepID=UPI0010655CCB|nr:protein-L-isoaspartate(D-aspartate) O-methyltransferase [Paraburkholderia caballeronis]TDV17223.1 protein-L-isoaspartate(D-aspartate) O-methyltransferase [Paraburkholderia caballeronis]TDV17608.1 protein-L-isoaspartate(D-aspartate) O-methyltransferase [Paraburkholderia caballeronis]TDV27626.1 protein-L-isoaspartate(D-aspartate) O-methyltransferase [Paraburkholderia caballeronis]